MNVWRQKYLLERFSEELDYNLPSVCTKVTEYRVTDIALILKNNVIRNYFKIYFTTLRRLYTFLGNETFLGTKTRTIPH